ncbi:response regulator transcription factor [Flavobacterium zepuense]|uniref:Response regulator transcription factor n=1 Tax=Flavobacterium zepuense TaxID=2593302 RepID=A0A552V1E4_9FLAO|nr:response regulator transcription factor [Flavobacterium zepuense]TRW24277.1 response regulator transcription factor [Flavobacterium zepuense]
MAKEILIVEDQVGISDFLRQGLTEEGYSVTIENSGDTGLIQALNNPFDLILLDWMLPKLTGLEICKTIRKSNKITPIIFLTAKDTVQETIAGLQSGANDYIKKPFSFEELLERIKVQFRNTVEEKPQYNLGPVTIKTDTHQVFNGAEEVLLTHKEFALLEFLLKNKGSVCTRTDIIQQVWNIHFDYDTGVIDVFINGIRKKLGFTKDENYIKTIRGVGYIATDTE